MFYRSSSRILIAALVVAALGAFAPTRADDRTSDLEGQLKKKEAEYKELQQKLQSQQDQASQTVKSQLPKRSPDQAWQPADQVQADLFFGQAPLRFRAEAAPIDAIHAAAAEVRDAKDEDGRKAAQKKLDEALGKYFDEDMVQREKDLKQVEERVTKLRDLLERRRAGKQEIIELEAKVALNQANGLGFYDGEPSGGPPLHPMNYKAAVSGISSESGLIPNFTAGGFGRQMGPSVKAAPPAPPTKVGPDGEPSQQRAAN
jgi:hypothetical protein